ncbi:hypothetical protein LCGC14_2908060 [marine sediment metagenome]|uniref:Uncharacterized protein n=1 Tax=marine sediment metagenome TaxID=412755 RepID=A0A0F8XSV0_9ZZZZ
MAEGLKRVGRFSIDYRMIEDNPQMVLLMLSGKLIIRAEARHEIAAIEYHAYCDDFDEVEPGQQIPEYVAEFSQEHVSGDDVVRVISVFQRWVRIIE